MATPLPYRGGWRVQMQKNGVRISETFKLKSKAIKWINEQEGKKSLFKSESLRAAADHYIATVSTQKRDAIKWETNRFRDFCAHIDPELGSFGDAALSDIDSAALGRWRDKMLQTVSGSTVLRYFNLYRNLFKLAHEEWHWIEAYPFIGMRLPEENVPRQTVWGWQNIKRVLREGQRRGGKQLEVTQAFHIALHTSLRLKEALSAPDWYNKTTGVISVPPAKTNRSVEKVPTVTRARRVLAKMPHFVVEANEASTLFSTICREILIEGLQYRDSRATCLTLLARKVDILTLARISRHRDMEELRKTYYRETAEDISKRL
jgi:hypothetical protein